MVNSPLTNYYHLCSKGTATDVLFHDQAAFVDGMNLIALTTCLVPIKILAFCIMDNHFHFILKGEENHVREFSMKLNQLYKLKRHYWKQVNLDEPIVWSIHFIDSLNYLMQSIAYVLNNPIQAGYQCWCLDYRWSSASLYFRDQVIFKKIYDHGRQIKEFLGKDLRKFIRSYKKIPSDWLITEDGYVWPGNYVDWQFVEKLFNNRKRMIYFLDSKKENKETAFAMINHKISLTDSEARQLAEKQAEELFGTSHLRELDISQRLELARSMIRDSGCKMEQMLKILRLKIDK